MKNSVGLFAALVVAAAASAPSWAAPPNGKPETALLPAAAYRTPLEEIIVTGKTPYWQRETSQDMNKPKVEAPKPGDAPPGRLQWAPQYTREERDDYSEPRDQLNPKARTKVFEVKF